MRAIPIIPRVLSNESPNHKFAVLLKAHLSGTNVRVVELVPPYVDTAHDGADRESFIEAQGGVGGSGKAMKPVP